MASLLEKRRSPARGNESGLKVDLQPELYACGDVNPSVASAPELICDCCGTPASYSTPSRRFFIRVEGGEIVACWHCATELARRAAA